MRWMVAAVVAVVSLLSVGSWSIASAQTYSLLVSASPDRSAATNLQGANVSGSIYVFTSPTSGVLRVRFFLDTTQTTGTPRQVENTAPYDFAGTATSGLANPFNTAGLANGTHTITAAVDLSAGGTQTVSATFNVSNGAASYQLLVSTAPNRSSPVPLSGYSAAGNIHVFTAPDSGVARVRFFLDDPSMAGAPLQTENNGPYDFAGTAASGDAQPFDTRLVADGSHTVTAAVDLVGGGSSVVSGTFTVANSAPAVVWSPDSVSVSVPEGGSTTTQVNLNATTGTATFNVAESISWLTASPTSGSTPSSITLTINAAGLAAGTYTGVVTASAPGYASDSLSVTLTVSTPRPPDQVHLAWTGDPSTTLVVVWRTLDSSSPSIVEYRRQGQSTWQTASGALRTSGTTGTLHEVAVVGLNPSTVYEYRVPGDQGASSPIFTTRTAPPRGPADFDAVYVADTGIIGRLDGLATGTQQVIDEIVALNPLVVLLGGDYAYFDTDKRFGSLDNTIDAWFNQMQPVGTRSPLMPAYGNHEVLLGEGYDPWAARFPTPPGFDNRRHYSFDVGDVHFVSILAADETAGLSTATLQWIEQDITAAKAAGQRWIVPYLHVSPFSDGANHPSNLALRGQLGPLFERLGVKVVISSHDQSFERTYPLVDVPATNTPTSSSRTCYTMADGVTWVKVSPGGKLSNKNANFSQFVTQPPPPWTAVRDNTAHHFTRLLVRAAGTLTVETYRVIGDGAPPAVQDRFQYTMGSCPPEFAFTPRSVALGAPVGGTGTAEIDLATTGGTATPFTVTPGASWLSVVPASGTTPMRLQLSANASNLSTGVHQTTLTAQGSGVISDTAQVTFTVGDQQYALLVSSQPDRTSPSPLAGATVSGNIYVFTSPASGAARVRFFLDDPTMSGAPRQIENTAPHDFAGTVISGLANPFATGTLAPGSSHTITAAIDLSAGGTRVVSAAFTVQGSSPPPDPGYQLHVSASADRSNPVVLDGFSASGNIYVFTAPDSGVARVRFFLDDPQMTGPPRRTENTAPFDFEGTANSGLANPFATGTLAPGSSHTITASMELSAGGSRVVSGTFTVGGGGGTPALVMSPETVALSSTTPSTQVSLNTTSGTASFSVSDNAPWLSVTPTSGSTPASLTLTADPSGLAPGTYNATVTATAAGYQSDTTAVTLTVGGGSKCSPLPCSEILVELPYTLEWSENHGKILDKNGVGTGFTYVDKPSNATGYIASRLTVGVSPGTLQILTTSGLAFTTSNSQDNALGVGIDAPSQVSLISTTLINPPAGTGNFEQAGLWFGNNENNYIKLVVLSTPAGTVIQALMEVNGAQSGSTSQTGVLSLTGATVTLSLRADPRDRTVTASYQINTAAPTVLGTFTAPPEFFSFDGAGIDPEIGTRTFTGVFGSHRNGPSPLTYTFGRFAVVADTTPPPPGSIGFNRTSFPVPMPTSMVWGPDGRLYVTEMFGTIHAITLNANKQVVADQVITTLGARLTLGITVDPDSTPSNVILWVSHSSPSVDTGVANSSTITRLSGPGFTTRQDVITGLPRAIANHAVNSLHFSPTGLLYIAQGGSTGAGAPNTATTEFGTRPEQPLSAALLVADVKAPGFQGICASPVDDTTGTASPDVPATCDVFVFASGLRNMYDFVFHSNGSVYGPDNGLGVQGTFPMVPHPNCQGIVNYSPQFDPGSQPDLLMRLELDGYYGHPNPARDECVFKDGSFQAVPALPNYRPGIFNLGNNRSANGTVEYTASNVCGKLRGELLIANYSVGDDITRIRLSADGRSVVASSSLAGSFNDPLPLALGPDGTIYVGELGGGKVTALTPIESGCWTVKASLPQAILDAGGTALNGKLYVVGGKTSAGPHSTMYVYDPVADSWTIGANLPGPAVENPAVVALGGKLYAFGGSTLPFSGAVNNAAVYDPLTNSWTPLAPMPTARGGASAQTINGVIYVVGGMDGSGTSVATVEVYSPSSNTWSTAAAMPTRRDNPGSAVLGGKLYVFGGRTRNSDGSGPGELNVVEMFDPAVGTWTARAPMPTGRRTMAVGTLNGRAQVMGGERAPDGSAFNANEEYNPLTNTWQVLEPMLTGRHGAVAGTINNSVYVVGGGPIAGSSFSNLNEVLTLGP